VNLLRLSDGFVLNTDAIRSFREQLHVQTNAWTIQSIGYWNAHSRVTDGIEEPRPVPEPEYSDQYNINYGQNGSVTLSGADAVTFAAWLAKAEANSI
jgi:hypothetical protein